MKLKYKLTEIEIDGNLTAVPVNSADGFHGILRINGITSDILKLLENDTDEDAIVAALGNIYNATEDQLRSNVKKALKILSDNGLLDI